MTAPSLLGSADPLRRYESESLRRCERLLVVPRALVGTVGLAVVVALSWPLHPVELGLAAVLLVAASAFAVHRMRGHPAIDQLRRLAIATLVVDVCAALLVVLGLSFNPVTPAGILLPLVVFEAVLKLGRVGLAVGGLLIAAAVGVRAVERTSVFGLAPRYPLIMVIVSVSGLLAGLAAALRGQERARYATAVERDRIRSAFRETIVEALRNTGVEQMTLDGRDLDSLLRLACQESRVGPEVGRRLAELLSPDPGLAALTRREREIVELLAQGRCDRDIAAALGVSEVTVRVHVSNAMAKLGLAGRPELVARIGRDGPRTAIDSSVPAASAVGVRVNPSPWHHPAHYSGHDSGHHPGHG